MKEGWTYKKLGEVCNLIGGGTPSKKNASYYNGSILWATVRDMNCDVLTSTEYSITEEGLNDSASHIVDKGEIIIATRVGLGKVCKLAQPTAINQDLKGVVSKKENINRVFLFYYFKTIAKYIESNGVGATVKGVKMKFIEELDFPIPPLSEQQRIVARLDAAFAHIDELKANAEKQLSEARTLFQKALAKAMEPKEGCEIKPLKQIAKYSIGLTYKPADVSEKGTIVLRSSNIQEDKLDLNDIVRVACPIKDSLFVKKGDSLMCSRNGSARLVGKVAVIPETKEKMTYGTFMMVISSEYNPYLFYFFKSDDFRLQIKHGEANMINQITRYMLDDVNVNVPTLSEQQRIVARLDSLSEKVRKYEEIQQKVIAECDALKQALLRKVFE